MEVCLLAAGSNIAASKRIVFVFALTSESFPPITPASPKVFSGSAINRSVSSKIRSFPSSVVIFSPFSAHLTTMVLSLTLDASNACIGWPYSSIIKFVTSAALLTDLIPESFSFFTHSSDEGSILSSSIVATQ
ncbi:MAG: hypothetical protein ACD_38C00103G0001 [uncultured bacterium]|nr:MAG: hypothetical protein ACD_38C00103G0001 [uncultured bacterium]